jgi:hypothetical protein
MGALCPPAVQGAGDPHSGLAAALPASMVG